MTQNVNKQQNLYTILFCWYPVFPQEGYALYTLSEVLGPWGPGGGFWGGCPWGRGGWWDEWWLAEVLDATDEAGDISRVRGFLSGGSPRLTWNKSFMTIIESFYQYFKIWLTSGQCKIVTPNPSTWNTEHDHLQLN